MTIVPVNVKSILEHLGRMVKLKKYIVVYVLGGILFGLMMEFIVFKGLGNNENYLHLYLWGPLTNFLTLPIRDYLMEIYPNGMGILFTYFFLMGGFLSVVLTMLITPLEKKATPQLPISNIIGCGLAFVPIISMTIMLNQPSKEKYREQELLRAVDTSAYSKAETLLRNGADVNCRAIRITEPPLCVAVRKNDIIMVRLLLKYNADPNEGYPLLLAAGQNLEIMQDLIKNKADINIVDPYGKNALFYCYCKVGEPPLQIERKIKMIEYLGEQGINPNSFESDLKDKTMLDCLMEHHMNTEPKIIAALKKIGAKSALDIKLKKTVDKINNKP